MHGVLANSVILRQEEIGVCSVLAVKRNEILNMVLFQGMRIALIVFALRLNGEENLDVPFSPRVDQMVEVFEKRIGIIWSWSRFRMVLNREDRQLFMA